MTDLRQASRLDWAGFLRNVSGETDMLELSDRIKIRCELLGITEDVYLLLLEAKGYAEDCERNHIDFRKKGRGYRARTRRFINELDRVLGT